eukprot:g10069.t1
MRHVEGGWPKDVDFNEQSDVNRFRKKAEKDEDYKIAIKSLGPIIGRCMKQNNTIDIYESTDNLVGGSYNGLINFFDLRKPGATIGQAVPLETSVIEKSHHDPVYDVFWISSKTEPTDSLQLATDSKGGGMVLGGSSMEYNQEAGPTKYLVGTEQGIVLQVNLRNRKQNNGISVFDMGAGKHHGPIYSIQRNPTQNKYFMTVGDWTARIWAEDLKTPIMTTKYHSAYLTSGCFSPTRAGVFFVTRMDGVVDIWDYFYRQNEVAYSHKVGDAPLSSISVQGNVQVGGKLVAVGDVNGTVSLLEVCESLAVSAGSQEKGAIGAMFEREMKQEKNLELRERDLRRAKAAEQDAKNRADAEKKDGKDERMEELLRKVDADFLAMIKEAEDDESKGAEGGPLDVDPADDK